MRRRQGDPKLAKLEGLRSFAGCNTDELRLLTRAADLADVNADRLLSMEGRVSRDVYVIVEGAAEARRDGEVVWHLGPGDIVGELGIAGPAPSAVTVIARTPMRVLVLSPQGRGLLFDLPTLARVACAQLSRQLRGVLGAPTSWVHEPVVDLTTAETGARRKLGPAPA